MAAPALASVEVAVNPRGGESLRVDSAGNAEVGWTAADGSQHSLLVSHDGSLRYGGLSGPDVSQPAAGVSIPWAIVVRQTADGRYYALQAWRRLDSGPVELRFSRWEGAPTKLTLRIVCCKWGHVNVVGDASFHGRPIYGFKATAQGDPLDSYGRNVYLDSYRNQRWARMMGILTHRPSGSFSLWIRPEWTGAQYRGTIPGPNWGWTLGPDAFAETGSSQEGSATPPAAMGVAAPRAARAAVKSASVPGQVVTIGAPASVSTGTGDRSGIRIALSAAPDPVSVGNRLTYTATITNMRAEASKSVTLYFMMRSLPADPVSHAPAAPTFVSATVPGGHCQNAEKVFICPLGTLTPGRPVTARFVIVPKTATVYRAQFAAQVYTHIDGEPYAANSQVVLQTSVHA
jgi:hypothetical protein